MNSESTVRLSKWCHIFRRSGNLAMFHSINLGVVFFPEEEAEQILVKSASRKIERSELEDRVGAETVQTLLDEGLIVSMFEKDEDLLQTTRDQLKREISLELLYLLVTDNCNLCCRYCFEETPTACATKFKPVTMSNDTARQALETFGRITKLHGNPERTKVIHLYGGELLLNPKVVRCAIEYVDELKAASRLPENTSVAIVTNGTLLTAELAELFAKHPLVSR
jgi:sulfatase maturation enzyme AslB (radical SAM superfamily)